MSALTPRLHTFQKLQACAAAGAHVAHLILRAKLGRTRRRVAAACGVSDRAREDVRVQTNDGGGASHGGLDNRIQHPCGVSCKERE